MLQANLIFPEKCLLHFLNKSLENSYSTLFKEHVVIQSSLFFRLDVFFNEAVPLTHFNNRKMGKIEFSLRLLTEMKEERR